MTTARLVHCPARLVPRRAAAPPPRVPRAVGHHPLHILEVRGDHNPQRLNLVEGGVRRIQHPVVRPEAHLPADQARQLPGGTPHLGRRGFPLARGGRSVWKNMQSHRAVRGSRPDYTGRPDFPMDSPGTGPTGGE